jgi:group I intron endonuclease
MKEYGVIYKITNLKNGKSYIGLTTKTLSERFEAHCNRSVRERSAIQKAIHKYGKENFTIEKLELGYTEQELFKKERYWISFYNTFNGVGYNLTEGGGGIPNMTQEIRDKISKTKTGKKIPKLKGRAVSKKSRIQISRSLGGKPIKLTNTTTGEEIILQTSCEGRELGLNPANIISCCKGNRSKTKGYTCQYINHANPDLIKESNNSLAVQRIDGETHYENITHPRDLDSQCGMKRYAELMGNHKK